MVNFITNIDIPTQYLALSAGLVTLILTLIVGRPAIALFGRWCREPNFSDSQKLEKLHAKKAQTPTMGGLLIFAAILVAATLFADWSSPAVIICLITLFGFGAIGLVDDIVKLHTRRKGLSAKAKLAAQITVTAIVAWRLAQTCDTSLHVPLIDLAIPIGSWYLPMAVMVIVGSSNAVNLTDGLDGLAAGCLACCFATMALFVVLLQSAPLSDPSVAVLLAATTGAVVGFWRFNRFPARVFMGDVGSLPLGAMLGVFALLTGLELVLVLLGVIFVAEALSVIIQVGVYKLKKRRVFLCAPLHHHFQFLGWSETTVVNRFHLVALLGALAAVGALLI